MAQQTLNTPREVTHQRIADALEDIVDKMVDTSSASNIDYDNTQSGLSANKVQGAVDELASEKADKSTTLAGYGITDAYTKAEVYTQSEVNNIVSTLETNIDWKEAVNTYADIAATYPNPQDGWTVNVKDTDYTYRYNGSEWVAISANAIPEATTSVKGLMTPTQVSKLNGIETGAQVNTVTSVAGKTGAVTLTKSDVGLGNVDNTSDLDKPISTAAQTALNNKVDKATGKGLSTNDYTNEEKQKNTDNASAIEDIQEDISTSQTATGNPLTIESAESNLVECTAEVEAVQDLHGYDHPWVGGAGKNKLPMTVDGIKSVNGGATWSGNATTINGVTFTILTDSDNNVTGIKANGTANATSVLIINSNYTMSQGSFVLNGCPSGGGTETARLQFDLGGENPTIDTGSGASFTLSETTTNCRVFIRIGNGYNAQNLVFKPMIRLSSVSDATFEPYSNICPIIGQTEVVIEDCGKNLWGGERLANDIKSVVADATINTTNKTISYAARSVSEKVIPTTRYKENTRYTVILKLKNDEVNAHSNLAIVYTDGSYASMYVEGTAGNTVVTCAIVSDANKTIDYILGVWMRGTTTLYYDECGIFEGVLTVDDFEPFTGKTYTIQLGDTIYGGELDVLTGELRVTHGEVDLGSLNYTKVTQYGYTYFSGSTITNKKFNSICSDYVAVKRARDSLNNGEIGTYNTSNSFAPCIRDDTKADLTDEQFKQAMNGVQLVYELAEPYTIDLTPQQIRLLKGTNNISCNTGDLSIKYYPDNVLGQLKGDIEDEIDAVANRIKGVKTMQISGAAVSTDGSIMFTSLIGSIIVGTSISNDANSNKCVGIPYSMGSVPALKIMNESTMAVLPNITISGILYYIEL